MKKAWLGLGLMLMALWMVTGCGKRPESAMWASAHDLELSGQYQKAIAQYEALIKAYPASPARTEVLFRIGLMNLYGVKDSTAAVSYFRRVSEESPRSSFGEAGTTLIDFIHSDKGGDMPEVLYHSGLGYTNLLGDYNYGVSLLDRITETYPESVRAPEAQFMKGFVWANSAQDTAKARQAYEVFLAKYPNHDFASAVEWELKYLGKDINSIPELQSLMAPSKTE